MAGDGLERVVHEYTLGGTIGTASGTVSEIDAVAHALPWMECPAAPGSARRLPGVSLTGIRERVPAEFTGPSTCTHLNDVLRSLAAGHDTGSKVAHDAFTNHPSRKLDGGTRKGVEQLRPQERHHYFDNTRRRRNLRKIFVAQVHGPVFAAGLMLMWGCDLIVAAEDTTFADVAGTRLRMCGVEYFEHPWEFDPRKTKELMLTGDSLSGDEPYQLGMVSKVFTADELAERTMGFARRIAKLPTTKALLIKESVNQTVDNMGFHNSLNACFTMHELNHPHWAQDHERMHPVGLPEDGLDDWSEAPGPSSVPLGTLTAVTRSTPSASGTF